MTRPLRIRARHFLLYIFCKIHFLFDLLTVLIVSLSGILTVLTNMYGDEIMKVFLVTQNQSHEIEIKHKFIWSPKFAKGGIKRPGYETMKKVRKGDIILNAHDQGIKGVSIAETDVYSADEPNIEGFNKGKIWDRDGWRVDVETIPVDFSLRTDRKFYGEHPGETFRSDSGTLQIRYLSELTPELISHFEAAIPEFAAKLNVDEQSKINYEGSDWQAYKDESFQLKENTQSPFSTADLNWDVPVEELMSPDMKAIIGLIGEKAAIKFLREKYPDATIVGRSLNLDPQNGSDSLGYDIEVKFRNGEEYLIDVKSTTGTSDMFFISANEYSVAQSTKQIDGKSYYILRVSGLNKDNMIGNVHFITLDDVELKVNSYKAYIQNKK